MDVMDSSSIPKNDISEKELLAKLQEHFKVNGEKDIIYHLLKLSGYTIDNGNLIKKDLLGQYERIIRIQYNKIVSLSEQCELLRNQQNRILSILKMNHEMIGKCIKDFSLKDNENLPLFGSTHTINVNKGNLNKNGNHMNDSQTSNLQQGSNNNNNNNGSKVDNQEKNYSFEPNVARSAFVNSRTRSAPHIDIDNAAPNPIQLLSKNNFGFPFYSTSTSSLNIPKGQLMYPSLSPPYPNLTSNLFPLNSNNNNKNGNNNNNNINNNNNGFIINQTNDLLKNNNNNNNSNNNKKDLYPFEGLKFKHMGGDVEKEQQKKSKRRKFED